MNFDEIIALRKAFASVRERQQENIPPDLEEKIKRLKVIRESSIGDEELLKRAIKRIEDNGIRVFTAKSKDISEDPEEIVRFVRDEIRDYIESSIIPSLNPTSCGFITI
ncbi:MAG: hypothetical protein HZA07_07150 [Nitrospirae bacterium]|nr:hypothetical protein [Nitrospirota bacterium]